MTSFGTLFKQLFKQKAKSAYLLIAIQVAASLVLTVLTMISNSSEMSHAQVAGVAIGNIVMVYLLSYILVFLGVGIPITLVYFVMTSWKNEKINRSQTWHLIPISSEKLYIANTLSSFVAFIYLNIIQAVIAFIGYIALYLGSVDIRKGTAAIFSELNKEHFWTSADWGSMIRFIIAAILLGLAAYITVSFYHFVTRAIIDFLPNKAATFTSIVVRFLMMILVIWLVVKFFEVASNLYDNLFAVAGTDDLGVTVLFLLFDIIFGGINIFLIKKFVEAKGDR